MTTAASIMSAPDWIQHRGLVAWVDEMAELCNPTNVHWCDGSDEEYDALCERDGRGGHVHPARTREAAAAASSPAATRATSPASRTARSSARAAKDDAGPTNNWMDPEEMKAILRGLFDGSWRAARCTSSRSAWARSARRSPSSACRSPTRRTSS